ncbi:uncharacterized protein KY384_008136 [Bacidia gigantensis]|uniref:uncharacterized protein n=1 Tax=Bacidia gigantensis TaxID=2732470 RepID=UPI001D05A178|nr:uncharacterized protein KY384_008136 [Bacidia gigantensis]KAG8526707.1 hypothetical protein KY384_008136 [Bacidia gigantensis]
MDKEAYNMGKLSGDSPEHDGRHDSANIVHEKGVAMGEAADLYGDLETAEDYGYVSRGLKSRHIQFIALGGTIGTGLFLGIGRAFTQAGPLSLLLGYTFTGIAIFAMMMSLGEMATWLPLPGAIPQFCARYVDGSVGFAVGWNNWYQSAITLCAEISAASVVIQFWEGSRDINVAAWISIIIVIILFLNVFAVSVYGEAEFCFASIKIITIVGLIIFAFIIDLGGGPKRDRLGFRYWNHPGAMKAFVADGATGRFLGLWSTLVNAAFSYGGVEMVAVAAGEAENPRHNIPKAVRRVFWRILFFYVLGSLAIGVLIPYNDDRLLKAQEGSGDTGAASPWVIAAYRAAVPILPSIINAVILTSATSSANAFLYTGSRYLYALAQNRQAPRFLLRCTKRGIPIYCILITASISLLTYMSCSSGSATVFTWFQNLTTIANLFTWMSVSLAYIKFHAALKAQGIDRSLPFNQETNPNGLVFRSPFQPYTAWFSLSFFALVTVFNGFYVFPSPTRKFDRDGFITNYVGIPIYFALLIFWKVFKRTKWVKAEEADIFTGKKALDSAVWPDRVPRNALEKICWVAVTFSHDRLSAEHGPGGPGGDVIAFEWLTPGVVDEDKAFIDDVTLELTDGWNNPYRNAHNAATQATDADGSPAHKTASAPQNHQQDTSPKTNGITSTPHQSHTHRPSLLHRSQSEKAEKAESPQIVPKSQKDQKPSGPGRKSSWVSSISSRFSSSKQPSTESTEVSTSPPSKPARSPSIDHSNPFGAAVSPGQKDEKKNTEPLTITPPNSPGKSHGFLQSAMRRLSASGSSSIGKPAGTGAACARKTMNIDPYRERCPLPDLEQQKLRRVAFSVDVEIAGSAQYPGAEVEPHVNSLYIDGEPQRNKPEREDEDKKQKDQKHKRAEGDALKGPSPSLVGDKDVENADKNSNIGPVSDGTVDLQLANGEEKAEPAKKKEKKKRSEEERKQRKERKQRDALAKGKIPAEIHREGSDSGSSTPPGSQTPPKAQDRPTTDPLRIYRRCCQLRETPVQKRIVEQISSPSACSQTEPGVLSSLDLSGYWMQLPDVITLGDYLAVVPVKRLSLENCGFGDEAVRVILAGLLGAKTPEQAKFNRKLGKKHPDKAKGVMETLGVIEKLNLKNNPKIGKEGWRYIALFLYLSRSLKAIDLSMIPFPPPLTKSDSAKSHSDHPVSQIDLPTMLHDAISTRLAGDHLEELVMSKCSLSPECVGHIVEAVIKCGVKRLGLASNDLTEEGFDHVLRYLRAGQCEGLDIGGNDVRRYLEALTEVLNDQHPLIALSLADCKLAPCSLEHLFPSLIRLPNFRFLDLSHNRDLFTTKPSAINTIRKYLPQFPILKRLHLLDVAMTPEHAIALAEVLPESKLLAHLNILENHLLAPLSEAKTETAQEEACAFYASYMAAVRVSESIICVDLEVPSNESSDIVKALAKQVVAYSLGNMERMPLAETTDSAIAAMTEPHGSDEDKTVPDILLHLVGHMDGYQEDHDDDEPAPDNDYIVGGTGLVKALDICLKRAGEGRMGSSTDLQSASGTGTPQAVLQHSEVAKGKAKEMSKNLLESARKIRARLQPALIKEARAGNGMDYHRLKFLDTTLEGMIQRFEDEYPETRLPASPSTLPTDISSPPPSSPPTSSLFPEIDATATTSIVHHPTTSFSSRRSSSPGLASRQAQEEGRMHRIGQRLRREIFKTDAETNSEGEGALLDRTGNESDPPHLQELRGKLEEFEGRELEERMRTLGVEGVLGAIGASKEELEELERKTKMLVEEGRGEGDEEACRRCREMRRIRERVEEIWREEVARDLERGGSGVLK